ncbi:MAG: hypothetical protein JWR01_2965 [Subtercola sp.]|nr:hypothetical protein [Subtercola sp.]
MPKDNYLLRLIVNINRLGLSLFRRSSDIVGLKGLYP